MKNEGGFLGVGVAYKKPPVAQKEVGVGELPRATTTSGIVDIIYSIIPCQCHVLSLSKQNKTSVVGNSKKRLSHRGG